MPKVFIRYEMRNTVEVDVSEEDFDIVRNVDNDANVCVAALNKYLPVELDSEDLVDVEIAEDLVNSLTDKIDFYAGDMIYER